MNKILRVLAFFTFLPFSFSTAVSENLMDSSMLDSLMLKNCRLISSNESCQKTWQEIQKGILSDNILSKAPSMKLDSMTQTLMASSASDLIKNYYCRAQFNNLIPDTDFDSSLFGYSVKGLSFSTENEKSYKRWLKSKASKKCKNEIATSLGKTQHISENKSDSKFKYTVVLNPIAHLENGSDEGFQSSLVTTYNHERLHHLFSESNAEGKVFRLWNQLTKGQQEQFKNEHSSYDFKNKKVLAREFFSYLFENSPDKAEEFLNGTWAKKTFSDIQQILCRFCISQDKSAVEQAKDLAKLNPKDLIAAIEKAGVKILILASSRKNPSPLFNWGQIRIDKGELNQITKHEAAMGKTLCQGEKPESKDQVTIILAADSPFSTLIHEYLHTLQIQRDPSWCPVSKQLWGKEKITAQENRMIRDREWDVRLVLWELIEAANMTVEDRLIISDGLIAESLQRKSYHPESEEFVEKNNLQTTRKKAITEYLLLLGKSEK